METSGRAKPVGCAENVLAECSASSNLQLLAAAMLLPEDIPSIPTLLVSASHSSCLGYFTRFADPCKQHTMSLVSSRVLWALEKSPY